jgi:oligoendopeptidase F
MRRRALGAERLPFQDTRAPLAKTRRTIPYEQARSWIMEGLAPLGPDYAHLLRRGLMEERWIDVYPNRGKHGGAYSDGVQGTLPFILTSYNNDLQSVSTLAHELGHSMHSALTWQTQPPAYSEYSIFVAEVASNFNQALLRHYLLETQPDPEFQLEILDEALANFYRYLFVMPTLARFELEIHQRLEAGQALSAESLMALMADLLAEGYGSEVAFDRQQTGIVWAEFPHHLYANFYVFQYATGISGAHALAQGVLDGKAGAVDAYLDFLKAGDSFYPLEALKRAGVDLTTPAPVERTFGILSEMVDQLETLLDRAE